MSQSSVSVGSLLPFGWHTVVVIEAQIASTFPLGPFSPCCWGPSFLGPFDASVLDPFGSCLGLVGPSFVIIRLDPFPPCPYHPLEVTQQVFLIMLVVLILVLEHLLRLVVVLEQGPLLQQVVVDHSYLIKYFKNVFN